MSAKGQTIVDRFNAAKYTLAGQALARCIFKATTEELMRPKKKHLDYLAACTHEINVSIPQMANLLIERTNHSNWAVVFKALITVHHLMSIGNERFTQYLASSNYSFQLDGFLDRFVAKGYAMSTFIRRYSNYINQKALSYRTLAVDLCKAPRSDDNVLRTMPIERLLETLPVIHKQLESLLDFDCTGSDLSNSIIVACFTLLFHDAKRLFASYNDGIINLFEKYFDLNKKMCREAFEAYKKFLSTTDRIAEFLKVAEAINLERGEIPDFKRAPSSLLDALEEHLLNLESSKRRPDTGQKVVIDTKLATLPSFSVDFNSVPKSDFSSDPFTTTTSQAFELDELFQVDKPEAQPKKLQQQQQPPPPQQQEDPFSMISSAMNSSTTATFDDIFSTSNNSNNHTNNKGNSDIIANQLGDLANLNLSSTSNTININNNSKIILNPFDEPFASQPAAPPMAPLIPQQPHLMGFVGGAGGAGVLSLSSSSNKPSMTVGGGAAGAANKKEFKNNFDAQLSSLVDKAKESLK